MVYSLVVYTVEVVYFVVLIEVGSEEEQIIDPELDGVEVASDEVLE